MEAVRRIQRIRREIRMRDVNVARVERVGSHFASITFKGEALHDFGSDSFDDHIKFIFQDASGATVRRDYTPRHFDNANNALTIEFALHGDGAAANWARDAKVGRSAIIGGPRGSMVIPMDYDWHLLGGDASSLPAISRRLEELPQGARVIVVAEISDANDQRDFRSVADAEVHWVENSDALISTLQKIASPAGDGFVWFAGEAATAKRVRDLVVEEKGHPQEATKIAAYWKHGASDFHERL